MFRKDDREKCNRTKVTEIGVWNALIFEKLENQKLNKIMNFFDPDHCKLLIIHQNHQRNNVYHVTWPKKRLWNFRVFTIFWNFSQGWELCDPCDLSIRISAIPCDLCDLSYGWCNLLRSLIRIACDLLRSCDPYWNFKKFIILLKYQVAVIKNILAYLNMLVNIFWYFLEIYFQKTYVKSGLLC